MHPHNSVTTEDTPPAGEDQMKTLRGLPAGSESLFALHSRTHRVFHYDPTEYKPRNTSTQDSQP